MTLTDPKLYLTFEGNDLPAGHSTSQTVGWTYILNRTIGKKDQLMSGLKSSSGQITLKLARDCPSIEDLGATEGNVRAVLKDGEIAVFTGYVSTNLKWGSTEHGKEILNVTLEGVGTRLLQAPFIESGRHFFRCTAYQALYAIVHPLGITIRTGDESKLQQPVSRDVEAGTTRRQLLDELCYECNVVYSFDANGQLCITAINPSTEDAPVIDSSELWTHGKRAVQVSKALRSYKGARVRYTVLGEANNYLVYRNTTGQDSAHPYCNFTLEAGQYFDGAEFYTSQEWSEAQADEFREPTLISAVNADSETAIVGSGRIVNISSLAPKTDAGSSIGITFTPAGGPYFSLLAHNRASSYSQNIYRLDLYASIVYEKSQGIIRTQIDGPEAGKSLLEEEMSWIHDKDNAQKHANLLAQYHRYGASTYSFNSKRAIPLGTVIELKEDTFSDLDVFVMVTASESDDKSDIVRYTAVGVSTFDLAEEAYHQDQTTPAADTKPQRGSLWTTGTALWGESYARGVAGIVDDMYLNPETGNLYRCVQGGSVTTARWAYIGNIKGKDASEEGLSYTLEYSLSTSPNRFAYYAQAIGAQETTGYDFGFSEDGEAVDMGIIDAVWDGSTYAQEWYKGLYVWQRIKTTDADGNVTYGDPVYCEELTKSLINGCILEVIPEEPTWEKNLAAKGATHTVTIRFTVVARSYGSIEQFEDALDDGAGVTITPYRKGNALDPIEVPAPLSQTHDGTTNLVAFTYGVTFNKGMDADGLVIKANIVDSYIAVGSDPETTYDIETEATGTMSAVDVTVADPFGGLFPTVKDGVSTIAEADALAYAYFEEAYEGAVVGATYALNLSGDHFLALRTYTAGGWVYLSVTGFGASRISAICGKAQKGVLTYVEDGSVTESDFGYFNVVIANIVTASFIGSKQIELQRDDQGHPGMIYGGDVDLTQPVGRKTTGKGFYFDSEGNNEVSDMRVRGDSVIEGTSRVEGKIYNVNNEDGKVVFETYKDSASGFSMQAASKVDGVSTPDRFAYAEWKARLASFCEGLNAGTLYVASGTITTQGKRSMPRKTLANIKRLTAVSSTHYRLVDEKSHPSTGDTDVSKVVWTNNLGKTITFATVSLRAQHSYNIFGTDDYGDTHMIVYESDGTTVYRDYGNNDDVYLTSYSNVSVPPGGKIWVYWQKSTRFTYECLPGKIEAWYIEADNWEVGVNLCFTDGSGKLLTDAIPSSDWGNQEQTFTCDGTTLSITFTAAASWPSGVHKYYGNFAWATAPEDSGGNPPVGEISTILIDTGSFTYAGQIKTIFRITFSTTSLVVEDIEGNVYNLSSGYNRAYTFAATTIGDIIGARARNLMPVFDNGVRVGGGFVGTNDQPWYQGWAQSWQQSSARAYKEDVEEYQGDALELLKAVQVVRYHYKNDRENPDRYWHYGFIADDTDEAMSTPAHNTMDLGNCIGILIRGVQLLAKELQEIKGGKK